MRFFIGNCGVIALILTLAPVFAQDPAPAKDGSEKGAKEDRVIEERAKEERAIESRKLLEEVLMARLTRELALDEEQTVLMVRHLAEFRDKMAAMRRERMVLARSLRQAVREGKDETAIGKVLEQVVVHEENMAVARREIVDFEGFELTTWQKAKLYLFIVDFESDMRQLLKQAQERRQGRGAKAGAREPERALEDKEAVAPAPETGGVGQSETVVAEICDLFLLLLAPAGGDELQGVKRGIMEMADLILVNKADGDLKPAALRTMADYAGALRLLRRRPQDPEGFPKAMPVSALAAEGLVTAWEEMQTLANWRQAHGHWQARRAAQARHWFEEEVRQGLLAALTREPARGHLADLGAAVETGRMTPEAAAAKMLDSLT